MDIKGIIDWFINTAKDKQILIILTGIIVIFYLDRSKFEQKIDFLEHRQIVTDSLYVDRLNNVVSRFQKKIDACNKQRVDDYIEQNKKHQEKYNEMFRKTDELYQMITKLNE